MLMCATVASSAEAVRYSYSCFRSMTWPRLLTVHTTRAIGWLSFASRAVSVHSFEDSPRRSSMTCDSRSLGVFAIVVDSLVMKALTQLSGATGEFAATLSMGAVARPAVMTAILIERVFMVSAPYREGESRWPDTSEALELAQTMKFHPSSSSVHVTLLHRIAAASNRSTGAQRDDQHRQVASRDSSFLRSRA